MSAWIQAGVALWFFTALLCLQSAAFANELVAPRFTTDQISLVQWQKYVAEVRAMPDIECRDDNVMQVVCDSASQRTIWTFTRAGHAAHPAVSRGVLVAQPVNGGTQLGIDRSGHYAGDRPAFIAWLVQLVESDRRQVSEWERSLRSL